MQFLDSARLFFRGPLWKAAGVLSGFLTAVAIAESLAASSHGSPWMWLFFGALALVVAAFYSFHRGRMEMEAKKESLPNRIDDLHREGIDLLAELRTPVEVERTSDGGVMISGEWAPDEWWEKVEAFEQRIRELFIARYPALLADYGDELEARVRKQREKSIEPPPLGGSKGSTAEKMLAFANHMRHGPARRMEASLYGLKAARHRVAASQTQSI